MYWYGMYMASQREDSLKFTREWKGVAVLYARKKDGAVEIVAVYEEHIAKEFREELKSTFGIAVAPWAMVREDE